MKSLRLAAVQVVVIVAAGTSVLALARVLEIHEDFRTLLLAGTVGVVSNIVGRRIRREWPAGCRRPTTPR